MRYSVSGTAEFTKIGKAIIGQQRLDSALLYVIEVHLQPTSETVVAQG